ncbi:hypothetical protein E2C01_025814 [Portunus trituberculatus]|uniref:Uncharacterized protein n=1 Tax=Portunus trituberculatus TaxID=210409 RepID=A0A5B7EE97_PORTR|nr:hypothetical protein [Portunus trituberculatus]
MRHRGSVGGQELPAPSSHLARDHNTVSCLVVIFSAPTTFHLQVMLQYDSSPDFMPVPRGKHCTCCSGAAYVVLYMFICMQNLPEMLRGACRAKYKSDMCGGA